MLSLLFASALFSATVSNSPIGVDVPVGPVAPGAHQQIESASAGMERFEAVGISWRASDRAVLRLRASDDGERWTDWVEATSDDELTDATEGRWFTGITHFGGPKRFVEYAFGLPEGAGEDTRATLAASDVRVTFFAPSVPRPHDLEQASSAYMLGAVKIRSRVEWGCPDGEGSSKGPPSYTHVTHVIVHHTAGSNSVPDWDGEMRSIWYYHTVTNGWSDIGYNYLIDPNGVIYEGRAGGDGVLGAHFSCVNSNTVGVALLGTYITTPPTAAAQQSLERLVSELCSRFGIQPDGVSLHAPTGVNLNNISGHRDGNGIPKSCTVTECPGDAFYALLPAIRKEIASCERPVITAQATVEAQAADQSATLAVFASGSGTLSYQWYVGLTGDTTLPVEGATASRVTVTPKATTSYWVRVTNTCGSIDSDSVTVKLGWPGKRRAAKPGNQ